MGTAGAYVGPSLVGWLKDVTGTYDSGMLGMAGVLVGALVLTASRDEGRNGTGVVSRRQRSQRRCHPGAMITKSPARSATWQGKGTGRLHVWETKRSSTPFPAHQEREP